MNRISSQVEISSFSPDEYMIAAEPVTQEARDTALFRIHCNATPAKTTARPSLPAAISPGGRVLTALIGLGAVAVIVVSRH